MNIQIINGKAFYEGVEIENQQELENLNINHLIRYTDKYKVYQDGTYPIPEGWEVVKEYWNIIHHTNGAEYAQISEQEYNFSSFQNDVKITVRLQRKEQRN